MICYLFDNRFDAEFYMVGFQSELPDEDDVNDANFMSYVYMVEWEDNE